MNNTQIIAQHQAALKNGSSHEIMLAVSKLWLAQLQELALNGRKAANAIFGKYSAGGATQHQAQRILELAAKHLTAEQHAKLMADGYFIAAQVFGHENNTKKMVWSLHFNSYHPTTSIFCPMF